MQFYFKTREQARKAQFGRFVDNGKDSPQGKRFARQLITTITGFIPTEIVVLVLAVCGILV